MELRQLKYFLAVGEELSFSRAAERCYVSQSAISLQIAKLEREMGEPLFLMMAGLRAAIERGCLARWPGAPGRAGPRVRLAGASAPPRADAGWGSSRCGTGTAISRPGIGDANDREWPSP